MSWVLRALCRLFSVVIVSLIFCTWPKTNGLLAKATPVRGQSVQDHDTALECQGQSCSSVKRPSLKESASPSTSSQDETKVIIIRPPKDSGFKWAENWRILPKRYAQVINQPAPVYRGVWADIQGKRPIKYLTGGFIWVSLESPLPVKLGDLTWYYVDPLQFMLSNNLAFYQPSSFKGVDMSKTPLDPKRLYGWLVLDTYTSSTPGRQEYIDGQLLEKHTLVEIQGTTYVKGQKWLKLAKDKWVDGRRVALITWPRRPDKIPEGSKWVDINLFEQVLEAFEGDKMVYATLISSGRPGFNTPTGLFRIWGKVRMAKMSGGKPWKDYYFLEDVPYQMFFSKGVAIHGAYWHNNFGIRQSHGCVNTSPRDAYWLYNWTDPKPGGTIDNRFIHSNRSNPGTYVFVHY